MPPEAVPRRPKEARPQPWDGIYWKAWDELRFDRQYGAMGGEHPVSRQAIRQFAEDHGIHGNDFDRFIILFRAIDNEWLSIVGERLKREREEQEARRRK